MKQLFAACKIRWVVFFNYLVVNLHITIILNFDFDSRMGKLYAAPYNEQISAPLKPVFAQKLIMHQQCLLLSHAASKRFDGTN